MFCRSVLASAFFLALSLQVSAHAGLSPALGVKGTFARNDVQRPSTASECGNVKVANTIDASTAVAAAADGTFTATVTNFNPGGDGSRSVSVKIDATGVGKTFVAGKVQTNGDANPKDVGSQKVVAALPAGTKCTGGKSKNLCLASFTTTSGFGNCVVVQQGAAGAAAAPPAVSPDTTNTTTSATPGAATPATKTPDVGQGGAAPAAVETPTPTADTSTPAAKTPDCGQNGAADPAAAATPSPTAETPSTPGKGAKASNNAASSGPDGKKACHEKPAKASAVGTRAARAARAAEAAME